MIEKPDWEDLGGLEWREARESRGREKTECIIHL